MKGFVPTPRETVDVMVERLFQGQPPGPNDTVLDPGCGTGEFIDGIIRWCNRQGLPLPLITGVESDSQHLPILRTKYEGIHAVHIEHADFLTEHRGMYNFIVGNPPYVAITALSESEKTQYRARYATAHGRFDLYLLFFEQALLNLSPGGRLVYITPEKYLYVESAGPLRALLARFAVEEIHLVREDTFGKLVTYPTITVIRNSPPASTQVLRRDGSKVTVTLSQGHHPWLPLFNGSDPQQSAVTLGDLCLRISCGVATGADDVFVRPVDGLDPELQPFAYPTIAGRHLKLATTNLPQGFVMLVPYDMHGHLLPFEQLNAFGSYLMRSDIRERLLARTCVKRKPWYAFHETPVLHEILQPKILCKDISKKPQFWVDRSGRAIPRHSVYYIVPQKPNAIDVIADYLKSPSAHRWLEQNCQRASKGFLRLQSRILRQLPLPDEVVHAVVNENSASQPDLSTRQLELAFTG